MWKKVLSREMKGYLYINMYVTDRSPVILVPCLAELLLQHAVGPGWRGAV